MNKLVLPLPSLQGFSDHDRTAPGLGRSISENIQHYARRRWSIKRLFDLAFAILFLILFFPIFAILGCAVFIADGAPVFYAHPRVGRNGKTFRCLKFRTMCRDADRVLMDVLRNDQVALREWNQKRKLSADPRVIGRVGWFLRKSSLDELPQIINVLRGDMSLVGPRPVMESELPLYGPGADVYMSIRPGLTGAWQVGGRSETLFEERVRLDVDYALNGSLSTDVRILIRTVYVVALGRGAC